MTQIPDFVLLILKGLSLLGILIYIIFGGVLVRQEQLMAHVLEESFEPIIRLLVIGHLVATIVVFVFALILL